MIDSYGAETPPVTYFSSAARLKAGRRRKNTNIYVVGLVAANHRPTGVKPVVT
jgi:hypothetical protein